jgi:hypothetical protein
MAKPKLEELRIRPGKDGHSVIHQFHSSPKLTRGSAGGLSMGQPPNEEHNFGAGQGNQMMQHIAQALAIKGLISNEEPAGD